jgi:hypothetical protein
MIFTKKIYTNTLLLLVLSSCKQKNTPEAKKLLKKPIETALIIQRSLRLPILSEFHTHYYNKTWPREKPMAVFS